MTELKLTATVEPEAADVEGRTIEGYAYTAGVEVEVEDERFTFAPESVKPWRDHVPVYAYHNESDPVGKLSESSWDGTGWKVRLKIANTVRGTEMLQLAHEGVLGGLSMFLSDVEMDDSVVTSALCREVSLVSHPAVPTAVLTGVALSAPNPKESDMTDAPTPEVELSASVQPTPVVRKASEDTPYPYLFNGGDEYKHSWLKDMESAGRNPEGSAAERLKLHSTALQKRAMKLAVTTENFPPSDPPNNQSYFYQTEPDPLNPLTGVVTTGTLPLPMQPMYVPTYDPSDEGNLVNPHVEGVEPALGEIGTFARTLVEPSAVSGKIAATRETTFTPLTERIIWHAFEKARKTAIETALGTMLNGLTLPAGQVKTIDAADAVDDIMDVLAGLTYQVDASRYTRLLVTQLTFGDLINTKDTTGRRLLNVYGQAVNSDGSVGAGLSTINIAGVTGRPIAGVTASYLLDPSVVHVLLSRELQFTFDYEISWVRYGFYQASMMFVTDKRGIIRLSRSA